MAEKGKPITLQLFFLSDLTLQLKHIPMIVRKRNMWRNKEKRRTGCARVKQILQAHRVATQSWAHWADLSVPQSNRKTSPTPVRIEQTLAQFAGKKKCHSRPFREWR